jgi:hypothetical protein
MLFCSIFQAIYIIINMIVKKINSIPHILDMNGSLSCLFFRKTMFANNMEGIIVVVFVLLLISASWIGTVIAALLRTSLGKSTRGKDLGRALSLVITLPMVAVMYAIYGGGLMKALVDPTLSGTVRAILGFLPSSWGADIFVSFATNPGNIGVVGFETLTRILGLITFSVAVLWLGSKVASHAYSLESFTFTASRAKADGLFYNTVR